MTRPRIKIYGERNTGSRYLSRLLRQNFAVELISGEEPPIIVTLFSENQAVRDAYFRLAFRQTLGWKHRMPPTAEQARGINTKGILFLTLTKNPYSWLWSLYRRPYHQERRWNSFESFLDSPWQALGRENYDAAAFENPVALWNEKNRAYLQLGGYVNARNLRYEDLLRDPEALISSVAAENSIPRQSASFVNVQETTKRGESGKDFEYYQRYYLEEQWKENVSSAARKIINEHLDEDIVKSFGYTMLRE